jgi:hypothetical protein
MPQKISKSHPYTLGNAKIRYSIYSASLLFEDGSVLTIDGDDFFRQMVDYYDKEYLILEMTDTAQISKSHIYNWKHGKEFEFVIFQDEVKKFLSEWELYKQINHDVDSIDLNNL